MLTARLVWCNQSGGSAIGSLSDGTAIEDIVYRQGRPHLLRHEPL